MRFKILLLLTAAVFVFSASAATNPGHPGSEISGKINITTSGGTPAITGNNIDGLTTGMLGHFAMGVYGSGPVMGVMAESAGGIALYTQGEAVMTGPTWLQDNTTLDQAVVRRDLDVGRRIFANGTFGMGPIFTDSQNGVKFLWYPRKGAIRAGYSNAGWWDDADIGAYSVVSGGYNNNARGDYATVGGGGAGNVADADASTISGGWGNSAEGFAATIPGGYLNYAGGNFSWAGGLKARIAPSAEGTFVWARNDGGFFESTMPNAFLIFPYGQVGKVGINLENPAYELDVAGAIHSTGDMCTDLAGGKCLSTAGAGGSDQWNETSTLLYTEKNVSIGAGMSNMLLTLTNDGGIVAMGTFGVGRTINALGSGTRMLWYPRKAAFRAGQVSGAQWDDANIGDHSVAFGEDNTASGVHSVISGGSNNLANGQRAATVAGGLDNTASNWYATVSGGQQNTASGNYSVVSGGYNNEASGTYATVGGGGSQNQASGIASTISGGAGNVAEGTGSAVPGGSLNRAAGYHSWAGGFNTRLDVTATGTFAWGQNAGAPHDIATANAFLIFPYGIAGSVGINTEAPDHDLEIGTGTYSEIDAGEAQFTTSSSRYYKENIQELKVENLLDKIEKIPVTTYDFREQYCADKGACEDKIGLIAEDFHMIFGRGSDKELSGQEVQMALWLAVQELKKENDDLKARVSALEDKLE